MPPGSAVTSLQTRCGRRTSPTSRSIPARAIAACTTASSTISAMSGRRLLLCLHEESAVAHRARLCQSHRQGHGGCRAFECRADARDHGDLQRLVRSHADGDPRRDRSGRCGRSGGPGSTGSTPRAIRARWCAATPNGTISRRLPWLPAKRCCARTGSPIQRRVGRLTSISTPRCRRASSPKPCRRSRPRDSCRPSKMSPRPI